MTEQDEVANRQAYRRARDKGHFDFVTGIAVAIWEQDIVWVGPKDRQDLGGEKTKRSRDGGRCIY